MNSFQVFIDRVRRDIIYQYSIIKSVLDWTVMLYFVIPGSIIAFFIYRSWWSELPPWSEFLSLSILISIAYLTCWAGGFRTFVKEADGIYFLKHTKKFLNMKKWAFAYSLWKAAFNIIFLAIISLPLLINRFSFTSFEIAGFGIFYIGLTFFIIFIKTIFLSNFNGWREETLMWLILITLFFCNIVIFKTFVFHPLYSSIAGLLFGSFSLALTKSKVSSTRKFQEEVSKEEEERLRYLNFIFRVSPDIEKPKIQKRKKPFLFRHSRRMFKKRTAQNGFFELFLKIIIRNSAYLWGFIRMVAVTGTAIVLVPPAIFKVIILIGFSIFNWYWMENLWNKIILSHPNSKQYENYDSFYKARLKANLIFSLPAFCFLLIVFVICI
jgi:ABC-2 type transport system permease protein